MKNKNINLEKRINKDTSLNLPERTNFKEWIKSELAQRTYQELLAKSLSEDKIYVSLREIFVELRKGALEDLEQSVR